MSLNVCRNYEYGIVEYNSRLFLLDFGLLIMNKFKFRKIVIKEIMM